MKGFCRVIFIFLVIFTLTGCDFLPTPTTQPISTGQGSDEVSYNVTFNVNGGLAIGSISLKSGSTIVLSPTTKEGAIFGGWYADENFNGEPLTSITVVSDVTLYAKWIVEDNIEVTVNFETNGGSLINSIRIDADTQLTIPDNPVKPGFIFDGWYTDEFFNIEFDFSQMVVENITLYAKWIEIEKVSVSFNTQGGSSINSITLDKSSILTLPENPIKDGFIFRGWFTEPQLINQFNANSPITTNITLYAKWEAEPVRMYTITFVSNGGNYIEPLVVPENTVLTDIVIPSRHKYEFRGWFSDSQLIYQFNISQPITSDITLYAKWSGPIVLSYLVQFVTNGANEIDDIYVIENTNLNEPDLERVGYTFDGWYLDPDFITSFDFSQLINQEYTLYAKWLVNDYLISFITNGGDELTSQSFAFEEAIVVSEPSKTGMEFRGWYLDELLTIEFNTTHMPAFDIILYAKWSTPISDFTYEVYDDYVEILSYVGDAQEVIIPDKIEGKVVSHISNNAFSGNVDLVKIVVGNQITNIGDYAFSNMLNLEQLIFPSGSYILGIGIINNSNNIKKIILSSELNYNLAYYFGTEEAIPELSFTIKFANGSSIINDTLLSSTLKNAVIELADDMEVISSSIFADNNHIKHLVIPEGVTTISDFAFENMKALESIVLPKTVELIGKSIFVGNSNLVSITTPYVGKTRTSTMKEGVLGYFFSENSFTGSTMIRQKDGSTFQDGIRFYISASLKEVIITDTLKLQYGTFNNVNFLDKIVLPEGLSEIGRYSIANAGIKELTIPASVTLIDRHAFAESQNLEYVYFDEGSLLKTVDNSAFIKCIQLKEVIFPVGLEFIGQEVFRYSTNLNFVFIPDTVQTIGSLSFNNLNHAVVYTQAITSKEKWQEIAVIVYFNIESLERVDNLIYAFSYDDKAMIIGSYGEIVNINIENSINDLPIIGIMDNVFRNNFSLNTITFETDSNIEVISNYAFYNCENLASIILPINLLEIGMYAFYNTSISSISIGENVVLIDDYAFALSNLNEITFIGDSNLEVIGYQAFFGLYLTEITIPKSVVFIDERAFSFNESLHTFIFEQGSTIKNIPDYMLYKSDKITSLIIPRSVEVIGFGAFSFITELTTVTFEENSQLLMIDGMAFASCTKLESIIIPELVEIINDNAFNNCTNLSEVIFLSDENLLLIGIKAFYDCMSLIEIVLPNSITTIYKEAFSGCNNLESVNIPSNLEILSVEVFKNTALTEIFIPASVKEILQGAFIGVPTLLTLTFEEVSQLTKIDNYAFSGTGIKEVVIPNSVDTIGESIIGPHLEKLHFESNSSLLVIGSYAFHNNQYLKTLVLPDNLQEIGFNAFGCYAPISAFGHVYNYEMSKVFIPDSVTIINSQAFRNVINLTIFTDFDSKPNGWKNDFNMKTTTDNHRVIYKVIDYGFINDEINEYILNSQGLMYVVTSDNKAYILGLANDNLEENILIPTAFNGYIVKGIVDNAFANNNTIMTIRFEDGSHLEWIGKTAFSECSNLSLIILPEGLLEIGNEAFKDCLKMRNIHIPKTVTHLGKNVFLNIQYFTATTAHAAKPSTWNSLNISFIFDIDEVYYNDSFIYHVIDAEIELLGLIPSKDLIDVVVPGFIDGFPVTKMTYFLFSYNNNIRTIVFLEDTQIDKLNNSTFRDSLFIEKIYLPLNIITIEEYAFHNNPNLVIYTKHSSAPQGWESFQTTVVWDYSIEQFIIDIS